jgi:hypothetical protein
MKATLNHSLRGALVSGLINHHAGTKPTPALQEILRAVNEEFCDLRCTPNPWAAGYWLIEAVTAGGAIWWEDSNRPLVGMQLGNASYMDPEVAELVTEATADGLVVSVNGYVPGGRGNG